MVCFSLCFFSLLPVNVCHRLAKCVPCFLAWACAFTATTTTTKNQQKESDVVICVWWISICLCTCARTRSIGHYHWIAFVTLSLWCICEQRSWTQQQQQINDSEELYGKEENDGWKKNIFTRTHTHSRYEIKQQWQQSYEWAKYCWRWW